MSFQQTTAQKKIIQLNKRVRIVRGGTSSSKTFSIIPILYEYARSNPKFEISIVSETIPHLRRGAIRDFLKILNITGYFKDSCWNKSTLTYTLSNGSFIEFFSADQPNRLRGARRDILFVNECNNITWESYYQLAIRTRRCIYLDYNPEKEFWVDKELIGDEDSEMIILTYKDNEALDLSIVKEIEKAKEKGKTSSYWANWYKVYGLGEIGSLQGVVFSNWSTIDTIPSDARMIGVGLDFGYTNDPSAIIEVYLHNGQRIINEKVYQTGMLNSEIAKYLPKNIPIWADSAEPKSIAELRRYGLTIKEVKKGADSIQYGIGVMQNQQYLITTSSINLIKELRGYIWQTDREGNAMNSPKGMDHGIDAFRYHEMMSLGVRSNYGHYSVQ